MIYLLDTNTISHLMRENKELGAWLSSLQDQDDVILCTITRGEILFGMRRLPQAA